MIKEYFSLMWRKTLRNKTFTLINIFGLSVGIAIFILIILWVRGEFLYDRYNENFKDIYRIEVEKSVYMVSAVAPLFKSEFPEVLKVSRFSGQGPSLLTYNDRSVMIKKFFLADSSLFDIFTYKFISGRPENALVVPFSIVLTESTARSLFRDEEPVGKTLKINNKGEYIVTGVVKDVYNTHMPVDAIGSFVTLGKLNKQPDYLNSFGTNQFPTYMLMQKGLDLTAFNGKMNKFIKELVLRNGGNPENYKGELIPLKDIYFHDVYFYDHLHGNLRFVRIFLLISVLTLLIACINFVNLTVAKSAAVSKEVGVRKVFGASEKQLFAQFLFESLILSFISSLFAITIIQLIIPQFNQLTGGNLSLNNYLTTGYIGSYFVIVLIIGLLAGIYPAIRLSSYNPVKYFRKSGGKGINRSTFRTGLVIFQFTVSIILILSVFIVIRQLNYMKNFATGFEKKNTIVFYMKGDIESKKEAFRNEIKSIPGIKDISFSSSAPGGVNNFESFEYQGVTNGMPVFTIDPSFIPVLGIKLSEGRNISWERPNDRYGVCLLNREAVKLWNIENPVGKYLKHQYYLTTIPRNDIEIIGIIDNYHYLSPRDSIGPALFCYGDWYNTVSLKLDMNDFQATVRKIEQVWKKFAPGYPFTFEFLDKSYERQYATETTLSKILIFFAFIAILIACLGLLGLTSYLAQERTKEIGIRKVFGATSVLIIRLLSANFLRWVLVAIIIGIPFAVITMNKWLSNFAYHQGVAWWLMALAALMLLLISLVTIIFHIVRVSRTNPINALKYE
jgi:putative ABC transport system permease protein